MPLNQSQLETIVAAAFPGERLKEARPADDHRYDLALPGGDRVSLQLYRAPGEARAAAAALRLLRNEIDLPIPALRAADEEGAAIGQPYLLTSELAGEPLSGALPRLGEGQLYDLGLHLGETMQRVHRLRTERFGELSGEGAASDDARGYILARLEAGLRRASEQGLLDRQTGERLRAWFAEDFQVSAREPALLHGGLSPEAILVRRVEGSWRVSALTGWGRALGWAPAWEHAALLESTDARPYFSLRVGYGNAYDQQTSRTYEQVREAALLPYRAIMALERMVRERAAGNLKGSDRHRSVLLTILKLLTGDHEGA